MFIREMKRPFWPDILFLAFVLIANAFFLNYNAFRTFNMLDMGAFMDASWRIYRGQRPYIDFIYYSGPLHLYMNAFFFVIFGFGKLAIWAHLFLVHSIIISAVFLLVRSVLSFGITALLILLTTASFYWSVSHPWHDVSAHFWGCLAMLVLTAQALHKRETILSPGCAALVGLFSIFSFLVKTNLGIMYMIMVPVVLSVGFGREKKTWLGYAVGLLLGVVIGLWMIRAPGAYWEQALLWNQGLIKSRLEALWVTGNWGANYYGLIFIMATVAVFWTGSLRLCKTLFILLAGITLIGIYAVNTGGLIHPANNFLWGIQVTLVFLVLNRISIVSPKKIYGFFRMTLIALAVFLTTLSFKYGLELKAWTYFIKKSEGNYALKAAPLRGWKFYAGQGMALDFLVEYAKVNMSAEDSVLNLTDMYLFNALTGRDGYRGVSFIFLEDSMPLRGPTVELIRNNILNNLPDWIIVDNQFAQRLDYLALTNEIVGNYRPVVPVGAYLLLKKVKEEG